MPFDGTSYKQKAEHDCHKKEAKTITTMLISGTNITILYYM